MSTVFCVDNGGQLIFSNEEGSNIEFKDVTAQALLNGFKATVSTLIAKLSEEHPNEDELKVLCERIECYVEYFFRLFSNDPSGNANYQFQFQFNTISEVLMEIAKLTKMTDVEMTDGVQQSNKKNVVIKYSLFCTFLENYILFPHNRATNILQSNPGRTEVERFCLEKKAKQEYMVSRLIAFLNSRKDTPFLQVCSKHLLLFVVKFHLYEIFDFLPNVGNLIQHGIKLKGNRYSRTILCSFRDYESNVHTLLGFLTSTQSAKNRMEATFNVLINNGLNVFICGSDRNNRPVSCLNYTYFNNHVDMQDGRIQGFHPISITYLTLLENGAGCLNRDVRHILPPYIEHELQSLHYYAPEISRTDNLPQLILKMVSAKLFESKQISERPVDFTRRLIESELVFKVPVPDQMRFIFDKKEFDQYVEGFDKLSMPEKINLRRMYESYRRLNEQERALLVPGFDVSMRILQEKMRESATFFGNYVSSILSLCKLPGNDGTGVQAIIFSCLELKDIDESTVPAPINRVAAVTASNEVTPASGVTAVPGVAGQVNGAANGTGGRVQPASPAPFQPQVQPAARLVTQPQSQPQPRPQPQPQSQPKPPIQSGPIRMIGRAPMAPSQAPAAAPQPQPPVQYATPARMIGRQPIRKP